MPLPSCLVPPPRDPMCPAFTLAEHADITAWCATVRRRGLRAELDTGHEAIDEAFHFTERGAGEPRWMLSKELDGSAVLTRCLDDSADIFATVAEALAAILATLDDEDEHG